MKGRNYPLGIQTFENIIRGNYVYVDKTALAYQMVHENKYCFLNHSFPYHNNTNPDTTNERMKKL